MILWFSNIYKYFERASLIIYTVFTTKIVVTKPSSTVIIGIDYFNEQEELQEW